MPIGRRRSYATGESAKRSICMSTCTATDRSSMAGSPALPSGPDRRSRCCRHKCHGQLRQDRAAVAGPHRAPRLRPGQAPAVYRHFSRSIRLYQKAADRAGCREVSASVCAAIAAIDVGGEPGGRRKMTEAVLAPPASRAGGNPWVVAAIVVVPTFMEVLDTTIAIVALRYIAGGLSATVDDGEWVITSYLAANALILPITGWLSAHLGRRNYFLLSIAVFTLASGLCGMATRLCQLILFRVLQGF